MASVATAWLLLSVVLAIFAWIASRRLVALSLPAVAALAAWAVFTPLGQPKPVKPPKGHYAILGIDIKENAYIKVLLKGADGVSTFYVFPYSNNDANSIQNAQDDARSQGGTPQASFGGDGDMTTGVQGAPEKVKPVEQVPSPN